MSILCLVCIQKRYYSFTEPVIICCSTLERFFFLCCSALRKCWFLLWFPCSHFHYCKHSVEKCVKLECNSRLFLLKVTQAVWGSEVNPRLLYTWSQSGSVHLSGRTDSRLWFMEANKAAVGARYDATSLWEETELFSFLLRLSCLFVYFMFSSLVNKKTKT